MRLTSNDETDLLAALYDGPFETPLWQTFLDRLRARVRAGYASIIFRPPGHPGNAPIELYSGQRSPPALQERYRDELHSRDPLPYFALNANRVYDVEELLDRRDPQHAAFFDDLLLPSGMARMRMLRVVEASGVSAWLSIARAAPDFIAADGALLAALAPHLARALRHHVALERERFRAAVTGDAIQRLNFGWLSLDAAGRIVEISSHAEQLLRHSGDLRRGRLGRLAATQPATDRALTAAIRACADSSAARPRALNIGRDPWLDLLLVPVPRPAASAAATPIAIAYLQGDDRSAADRHEQIADLFGLLKSEARLALALSRGLSIVEAAAALGLTEETARNYSKKIFAKTGARGQTDLVRFILTGVLALA